ncbi:MAG: hypothetical protein KAI91_06480 [Candidatus Omnitrophica bacterium]|nr:hypothetical protein [Candidatus Omnitrophota bacterium]MCK5288473.1 hypothetical protein [Candidatus Omnitrophota bacterium]MCK5393968.1 hypothetical protein [Candidatus Omnitrophota bacterium]
MFNQLGDLSKMAAQAKQIQDKQDRAQREQADLLRKISTQLSEVIVLLKDKK